MGAREQVMGGRSWVQRVGEWIPGFRGYYAREHRRDADRLVRDAVSARLKAVVDALGESGAVLARSGRVEDLKEVERTQRLSQRLATLADRVRTAAGGYAGFFDAVKVLEPQLHVLYEQDQALLAGAEDLKTDPTEAKALALEQRMDRRRELIVDLSH